MFLASEVFENFVRLLRNRFAALLDWYVHDPAACNTWRPSYQSEATPKPPNRWELTQIATVH